MRSIESRTDFIFGFLSVLPKTLPGISLRHVSTCLAHARTRIGHPCQHKNLIWASACPARAAISQSKLSSVKISFWRAKSKRAEPKVKMWRAWSKKVKQPYFLSMIQSMYKGNMFWMKPSINVTSMPTLSVDWSFAAVLGSFCCAHSKIVTIWKNPFARTICNDWISTSLSYQNQCHQWIHLQ